MQFTTGRSKEKDYDMYLKSEKLVHSNQEHETNVSQLFGIEKNCFLAILSLTNTVAAIWREINVDPCNLETKKSSSQMSYSFSLLLTVVNYIFLSPNSTGSTFFSLQLASTVFVSL